MQPAPQSSEAVPFLLVGVSHHRAGVAVRERFALNATQQAELLHQLRAAGATSPLVISTCNRTEVFARHTDADDLIEALLTLSGNSRMDFDRHGHVFTGPAALEKLFRVGAGLDSQILGDLQIVKQVKDAYQLACDQHLADATLHRLMNHLVRAHKRVRRETSLGKGAASIAGAAVQFVLQHHTSLADKNILLVGTGKIGKVTCKNLLSHNPRRLTLLNRTEAKAQRLGDRFQVEVASWESLEAEIAAADVVIVATGATTPVIHPHHVQCPAIGQKILIDLSVPRNISPKVADLPNVTVADLDALQAATDSAYQERLAAVPAAEQIVRHELENLDNWLAAQRVAPTIRALQDKFEQIRRQEIELFRHKLSGSDLEKLELITERIVKKIAAHSIDHLRQHPDADLLSVLVREMFKLEVEERAAVEA